MSYILDALRRLEQDKERSRKGTNPMEAVLVPDFEVEERSGQRRLWWVGIGVLLLAVAVGTTYWMTRRTLILPTAQVQKATTLHVDSTPSREDLQAPVSLPGSAPRASLLHPSGEGRPTTPAGSGAEELQPATPSVSSPESSPHETPTPPILEREPSDQPIEDTEASPTVGISPDVIESEVILPLEGEEIKINAIAYSRDVKKRFALVNLKTVHEGDTFEGYSVVEIEEDGIVFERGGTKYRMSLGKR